MSHSNLNLQNHILITEFKLFYKHKELNSFISQNNTIIT